MESWKKEKIVKAYILCESDANKNWTRSRKLQTVKNPSIQEIWFYHIKNKNIKNLQEMIDQKVIDIDQKYDEDGETIVHCAIQVGSRKLIDFCIKNKANFYMVSSVEEETGFYEASQYYVSTNLFIKVWSQIEKGTEYREFCRENCEGTSLIKKLCCNDKNLEKIFWIEKQFPESWERLKSNKKQWNEILDFSKEKESQEVLLFLKGLQKIKNELEKDLQNKIENTKRLKI